MPEGPEVRTVCDVLRPLLEGKHLLEMKYWHVAKIVNIKLLFPEDSPAPVVISVVAYGKKTLFYLSNDRVIVGSLGMEGSWVITKGKHSNIEMIFGTSMEGTNISLRIPEMSLWFNDTRRMGNVTIYEVHPQWLKHLKDNKMARGRGLHFIPKIGPDILETEILLEEWMFIFRKSPNRNVATILMDQDSISGIGNYLKSDICYVARILPNRISGSLNNQELENLRIASHQVIRESYSYGGLTIKSFWSPDGRAGTYPNRVYNKTFDPEGRPVSYSKINGRGTYWVPGYQI